MDFIESTWNKELVIRFYYLLRIILILAGLIIFITWHKGYRKDKDKAKSKAKDVKEFPQTLIKISKPIERLSILIILIMLLMVFPKALLWLAENIVEEGVEVLASNKLVQIFYLVTVCVEVVLLKIVMLKGSGISIREYIFSYLLRRDIKHVRTNEKGESRVGIILKGLCLSSFVAGVLTYLNSFLYEIYRNMNEGGLKAHDSREYLSKIFIKGGGIEQILDIGVFLYVVIIVILAPIIEEIIFRGTVLGILLKRMSFLKANIVSSLLFAFMHFNIYLIIPLMGLGYVLGLTYERGKSLYVPILVHSLWNQLNIATYILLYT